MALHADSALVLGLLLLLPVFILREWLPTELAVFSALCIVWAANVISATQALSGFSDPAPLTLSALYILTRAVQTTQLFDKTALRVLGSSDAFRAVVARLQLLLLCASACFPNVVLIQILIPVIAEWARNKLLAPSKLLIPMSYAIIAGGPLTTIGSAPALIVQGLLFSYGQPTFHFFEPAYVGIVPALFVVLVSVVAGHVIFPEHDHDLIQAARDHLSCFVTELEIREDFRYVGRTIAELEHKLRLPNGSIIKIRRRRQLAADSVHCEENNGSQGLLDSSEESDTSVSFVCTYRDIFPVSKDEIIRSEDVLIFSGTTEDILSLNRKGITSGYKILRSQVEDIAGSDMLLYEVVVSTHNKFVGTQISSEDFSNYYQFKILALRQRGPDSVATSLLKDVTLKPGDTLLVLSHKDFQNLWISRVDFLSISVSSSFPKPTTFWDYVPFLLYFSMLILVASEACSMVYAMFLLILILFAFRWVDVGSLSETVDWNLLLLVSSSIGFGAAVDSSGLASEFGASMRNIHISSYLT
jgi:di/tricarboxylate transporter